MIHVTDAWRSRHHSTHGTHGTTRGTTHGTSNRTTHGWSWLALVGLAAVSWRCVAATHARKLDSRPAALPEPLQVWEDEGGQNQMPDSPPAHAPEATAARAPSH
jgi:hypothetical protein